MSDNRYPEHWLGRTMTAEERMAFDAGAQSVIEPQTDESITETADELRDMATWFDQCGKQCNGDFLRTCANKLEILHGAYSTATRKLSEAGHDH